MPISDTGYTLTREHCRITFPSDAHEYDSVVLIRRDATPAGEQLTEVATVDIRECASMEEVSALLSACGKRAFTPIGLGTSSADVNSFDDLTAARLACGCTEYSPLQVFQPTDLPSTWEWTLDYGSGVGRRIDGSYVYGANDLNINAAYATVYCARLTRGEAVLELPVSIYHHYDRDGGTLGFRRVSFPLTGAQMPRPSEEYVDFGEGWRSKTGANAVVADVSPPQEKGGSMGILSGILKFFKKLFKAVFNFIKRNWLLIAVLGVAVAVFFPAVLPALWGLLSSGWAAVSGALAAGSAAYAGLFTGLTLWEGVALAAGTAFIIAPEETGKLITKAGDAIGTAVGATVGGAVGAAASTSGLNSVLLMGAGLLALYFVLGRKRRDPDEREVQ